MVAYPGWRLALRKWCVSSLYSPSATASANCVPSCGFGLSRSCSCNSLNPPDSNGPACVAPVDHLRQTVLSTACCAVQGDPTSPCPGASWSTPLLLVDRVCGSLQQGQPTIGTLLEHAQRRQADPAAPAFRAQRLCTRICDGYQQVGRVQIVT